MEEHTDDKLNLHIYGVTENTKSKNLMNRIIYFYFFSNYYS